MSTIINGIRKSFTGIKKTFTVLESEITNIVYTALPFIFKMVACLIEEKPIVINSLELTCFTITLIILSLSILNSDTIPDSSLTKEEKNKKAKQSKRISSIVFILLVISGVIWGVLFDDSKADQPAHTLTVILAVISIIIYLSIGYTRQMGTVDKINNNVDKNNNNNDE